jgi:hypothetical protein
VVASGGRKPKAKGAPVKTTEQLRLQRRSSSVYDDANKDTTTKATNTPFISAEKITEIKGERLWRKQEPNFISVFLFVF